MRIVITGAGGLVGRAMTEHCFASGDEVYSFDHASLDIRNRDQVMAQISRCRPDAVVNCAAWTDVDGCESNPGRASSVNADGPENLARASREAGAAFLTISTDYVFDGTKEGFYTQRDDPNPLSVYGHSKLNGEWKSRLSYARTIVVRTGFIFGRGGKNFLSGVVDRAQRGEELNVIHDAWGTPTYAPHLATRLRELVMMDLPGIFHVINEGAGATYQEFASVALELAGCPNPRLHPVSYEGLKRPAPRPRNSKLRCLLSPAVGLVPLPAWQDGLAHFLETAVKSSAGQGKSGLK